LALVTGSSSGIGRAVAIRLARDGYFVLVHYNRNEKGAAETLATIESNGGRGQLVHFDTQDREAVDKAMNEVLAQHEGQRLDVLVNNAGITKDTLLGIMSDEAFDSVMKTNVYGAFYLLRYCVKKMLRQRVGSIVNMASLAGQTGNPGQVNYAASKAALIAMTKSAAMEVGSRNVRVNAVAPGLIETDMIHAMPAEMLEHMKKRIPLGRVGSADEVAGTVSFLCSKDAGYITGATISVNGGLFPA
jgi:3-oxoacyl-[acyl-carrier protein] reductase